MIEIVASDPLWPAAFEVEAARIRGVLGALAARIDHHGSTAVPGLRAKPVIDIQVSVAALQPMAAYLAPLTARGYTHLPHADYTVCPFFHRPERWPHTHHIHVVESGGLEERRTLAFRDYLRDHREAAHDYERLKQSLAARLGGETAVAREAYARGKSQFIDEIVARALSSGYPH